MKNSRLKYRLTMMCLSPFRDPMANPNQRINSQAAFVIRLPVRKYPSEEPFDLVRGAR